MGFHNIKNFLLRNGDRAVRVPKRWFWKVLERKTGRDPDERRKITKKRPFAQDPSDTRREVPN